jgi:hypothetical protein
MNIIMLLVAALVGAMIFLYIIAYLILCEMSKLTKDMLNRLMARDFTEYVRGDVTLHPAKEKDLERREEEAIPI